MITLSLTRGNDFEVWWRQATATLRKAIPPQEVVWDIGGAQPDLFAEDSQVTTAAATEPYRLTGSEQFRKVARRVICHSDPARHAILYRLLWRLQRDRGLLDRLDDPDVQQLQAWHAQIRRAAHKMKAFVRFRQGPDGSYVAWFDPGHPLLEAMAPFFIGRFAAMRWLIVTPDSSCAWDGKQAHFGPGAPRTGEGSEDPCEEVWRTYYANIFNPARLKPAAMRREMPVRYWRDLPEATLIAPLMQGAGARTAAMIHDAGAESRVSQEADGCRTLSELGDAVRRCTLCPAGCLGTRAVAGEGPATARIMLVGEQPGDLDEQAGHPFVGPAGQMLNELLDAASLPRTQLYVTNTVKHFGFKYQVSGKKRKKRLHQRPSANTVKQCLPVAAA